MATRQINWGDKVRGSDIPKFKGTPAIPAVISVIAKEGIRAAQTHYIDGMGHFHCFDGICCQDAGKAATVRYLLPIVVYRLSNPSTYEIDLSKGVEVMYHAMNERDYDKLMTQDSQVYLDQCDMLVTTVEKGRFQEYTFQVLMDPSTRMAKPVAWRQNEQVRLSVMSFYNTNYLKNIDNSVGREFKTVQDYLAAKQKALQNASQNASVQPSVPQIPPPPAVYLPQGAAPIGAPPMNNGLIGAMPPQAQIPAPQQTVQQAPPIPVQATPVAQPAYVEAPPVVGAVTPPPTAVPPSIEGGMDEAAVAALMAQ